MRKFEFSVSKQNNLDAIKYVLGVADVYDDKAADKSSQIANIIPLQYIDEDGKRSVTSYSHEETTLAAMMKTKLNKKEVLCLLGGVATAFEIGAQGIPVSYIVRDTNYVFVDKTSLAVKCMIVPIKQDAMALSEMPVFFREIISNMMFDEMDTDNYVAKLLTVINSNDFAVSKLKQTIEDELKKIGVDLSKIGEATVNDAPPANNVKVNKLGVMAAKANQQPMMGQPMMGQPMPGMPMQPQMGQPMPGMPMQPQMGQPMPGAPMPPMGQPMPGAPAPMGQPMPGAPKPPMGGQPMPGAPAPMGQPMPGAPKPPMGGQPMPGAPKPPMGQPMPGAPAPMGGQPMPGAPKPPMGQPMPGAPAPMGGQPMPGAPAPQAPVAPAPAPSAPAPQAPASPAPAPSAPAPQAPKPAAPMPSAPAPQATVAPAPAPSAPAPQAPAAPAPAPSAPAPQAPKPAAPMPSAPAPQAPVAPAPAPSAPAPQAPAPAPQAPVAPAPMPSAPAPQAPAAPAPMPSAPAPQAPAAPAPMPAPQTPGLMEHGSLVGQLGNVSKPVPHIIRKKTGEVIYIDKQEFSIGKSKTKADYPLEDNTAISRVHCIIVQQNGVNYIKDNNSTNHTFLNGVELEPNKEVLLKHKSVIQMGDEEFTFLLRKGD